MDTFSTPDSSENTIAILGDRWWSQAAKQEGGKIIKKFLYRTWKNVLSTQKLEVSLLLIAAGMVFRLERDAYSSRNGAPS